MSYTKDPDARLDYSINWAAWLATGETITASTWTVPAGLTSDSNTHDNTSATVWLSGGTAAQTYQVVNHITTSAGRVDDRTLTIFVSDR